MGLTRIPAHDSVRQQVAASLRASLISGDLRPGTVYSAPELAEQLGTSPTPVREAMLELAREGAVEVVRNTGYRVTVMSVRQLDELAELRILIEVPTMGAIAEACRGDLAERVEALRPQARRLLEAADSGDLVAYMTLDTQFHADFLVLHGNTSLVEQVIQLRYRSRLYGLEALAREGTLGRSTREHEQLVDLALQRDRAGIESLLTRHIRHTRNEWARD